MAAGIPRAWQSSIAFIVFKVILKSVNVTAVSVFSSFVFVSYLRLTIYFLTDRFEEI